MTSNRRPKPNWPRTTSRSTRTGSTQTPSSRTPSTDDAEFDEIVRHSGVADTDPDAEGDDDGKVLEPAGVGAATASKAVRERRPARAPKGTPTGKRDQAENASERRPPSSSASRWELRKVVYPSGQQLIKYFVVVLVFVLFVIAYVSVLDLAFGAAIFKIFA